MSAVNLNKETITSILSDENTEITKQASNDSTMTSSATASALTTKVAKPQSEFSKKAYEFLKWALPPIFGIALFLTLWTVISHLSKVLPGPVATFISGIELFADPFYINNLNDQGIGWNIVASLERVGLGFGLAALVGIPLGFLIGRFEFISRMTAPVIGLLRPVSPLAWLPLGLLVLKAAGPAAIWVIFISSIWPMVINTAVGVSKVPQDYMNVAKVLNLSEWKIVTKISFPYVLPYMMTGVRLSMGIAWLVIVAAEMLNGGVGIGFWLWDEYNASNYEHIILAILIVGVIGLLLEKGLMLLAKRFQYE